MQKNSTKIVRCRRCGKRFQTWRSNTNRKYCGMRCRYTPQVRRRCCSCNALFFARPCENRRYCTWECYQRRRLLPAKVRFWKHVQKTQGCWLWAAGLTGRYGHFEGDYAHRFAWRIHFGPIPKGRCVCHRCDVPLCVRPDHLFLGTHKDNTQDAIRKGRFRNWRPRICQSCGKEFKPTGSRGSSCPECVNKTPFPRRA
jgi:hypothetical protein